MNYQQANHISDEVRKLKLHLERFPEQALDLAIAHYQDFMVLASETEKLEARLNQLKDLSINPELIWHFPYSEACLTLEQEFRVERLRRHILKHPIEAKTYAIVYFQNHLISAQQYQKLEAQFDELKAERIQRRQLSLPSFL